MIDQSKEKTVGNATWRTIRNGTANTNIAATAVLVNLVVLFCRPQNDLTFLATIQFPLLLSLFPLTFWLSKATGPWTKQMKIMACVSLMGAAWIPFAVNTRFAFEGFRSISQMFLCIMYPLTIFMANGKQLRRLGSVITFCAFYIALYGFTHSGTGPGDYLGDENDLCLCLDMFLGILLGLSQGKKGTGGKLRLLFTCVFVLAAIIATGSRGGFLGLIAVAGYHLWFSEKKFQIIFAMFFLGIFAAILAPASYWERIRTIAKTNEGSALERRETWNFAWQIFTRKEVFLFGTGMKNTPVHLGDFKTSTSRNLWGRQTHSLYFEVLPDLGLAGFSLLLAISIGSFTANRRRYKELLFLERRLPKGPSEVRSELRMVRGYILGVNAGWIAILVAGAFISIFYYPVIWFLGAISGSIHLYSQKLLAFVPSVLEEQATQPKLEH